MAEQSSLTSRSNTQDLMQACNSPTWPGNPQNTNVSWRANEVAAGGESEPNEMGVWAAKDRELFGGGGNGGGPPELFRNCGVSVAAVKTVDDWPSRIRSRRFISRP